MKFEWPWKKEIRRSSGELYLTRYYLFRKPVWWLPSIYIHCIHLSDEDRELHSHPWNGVSFILKGSYEEERRTKDNRVVSNVYGPGKMNVIRQDTFHRLELIDNEVWTLFISGKKNNDWGFWNRNTKQYLHWREHVRRKRSVVKITPETSSVL